MERLAYFVRSQEAGLWVDCAPQSDRATKLPENHLERRSALPHQQSDLTPPARVRSALIPDWLRPGSRDLTFAQAGILRSRVTHPKTIRGPLVGTACLEAESLPLHEQIVAFCRRAQAAGAQRVRLIPLFLLAGVHVKDDIPAEVEQAQAVLPDLTLDICPHLGSHPGIKNLLRQKLDAATTKTSILLAHGSRRPGGNDSICSLAQALGGTAAFWATAPSLESQVIHHMQAGKQRVAILPYFLFAGSTTDGITHLTEELAERFPQMGFHLLPPLGPSPELARLVIDLALDRVPARSQQALTPMRRVAFRHAIHSSTMVS